MNPSKLRQLLWLLGINLFISTFTFGGGYVVVPMIRKYYVIKKQLFTEDTLMEMAAIAQSTPGAIAVNLSALAGFRVAGVPGAVVSCLAAVTPPLVILCVVSLFYTAFAANRYIAAILRGMQAGVSALIVDLTCDMCRMVLKERSLLLTLMVPAAFVCSFLLKINVAIIIGVCCLLCAGRVFFRKKEASL